MSSQNHQFRNRSLILFGLGLSLLIAVFLSPLASKDPDGLERVAEDHKFAEKAAPEEEVLAKKLPFSQVFEEYSFRGAPAPIATPLAGLLGTIATFGIAWGVGKILVKGNNNAPELDPPSNLDE